MSLQVGDVVYVTKLVNTPTCQLKDRIGTVKYIHNSEIGIDFGENVGGHNLNGHCQSFCGYYVQVNCLVKMEPLSVALQKQWREWESKLKKEPYDPIILIE